MKFYTSPAQDPNAIWNQTLRLPDGQVIKAHVWQIGNAKFKFQICNVTLGMRQTLVTSVARSLPSAKKHVFAQFTKIAKAR